VYTLARSAARSISTQVLGVIIEEAQDLIRKPLAFDRLSHISDKGVWKSGSWKLPSVILTTMPSYE
jgi:hypothetical protein